ncbi:MAG: hypothetical protein ACTTH7_03715 [Treponema sp.]
MKIPFSAAIKYAASINRLSSTFAFYQFRRAAVPSIRYLAIGQSLRLRLFSLFGNTDLFTAVFQALAMHTVKKVTPGYGDYLVYAIINNKPQIIEKLLAYNQNTSGSVTEKLMDPRHTFAPDFSKNSTHPTHKPVVQFLRTKDLRNNAELLKNSCIVRISIHKSELCRANL